MQQLFSKFDPRNFLHKFLNL